MAPTDTHRERIDAGLAMTHSGSRTCSALSSAGMYGLRSRIGVLSEASMASTFTHPSSIERMRHVLRAIRLGRKGERHAKTPVKGLFLLPRGWT